MFKFETLTDETFNECSNLFWKIEIPNNWNFHILDRITLIEYIVDFDNSIIYINNFDHHDYKKSNFQKVECNNACGLYGKIFYYYDHGSKIDILDFYNEWATSKISMEYADNIIANKIIPTSLHEQAIVGFLSKIKDSIITHESCKIKYSNVFYKVLNKLTNKTIYLDNTPIYQNYEPFTLTSRPTNNWNSFNWNSFPRKDRYKLKSNDGDKKLLYSDISACFLTLTMKSIGYPYSNDPYKDLMDEMGYMGSKDDFKPKLFSYLYGNVELPNTYFFNLYFNWKNSFAKTIKNGYILTPLFKRRLFIHDDWNIEKCVNLYMQSYETELQFCILYLNNTLLESAMYYLFDGIVFEISENDIDDFKDKLRNIYSKFGLHINFTIW